MDRCCFWEDFQTQDDPCKHQQTQQIAPKCPPNTKAQVCERLKQYHELSTILTSVLDITATITQIMEFVGIHQCKCQKAMDIIIYAFLHFDEFTDRPCGHSRKQIRKDEFLCDLRRDCCFTKQEAKITYGITKYAFQAFYYKQVITRFDDSFIDNCVWLMAAKKTIKAYKQLDGVEPAHVCTFSANVHCAYRDYIERRRMKADQLRSKNECICTQNRSSKNDWVHALCDTSKQPCSAKKPGLEFTKKICTCVCDDTGGGQDDPCGGPNKSTDKSGYEGNLAGNKTDETILDNTDCSKLKTCEEQLKCVQNQLLNYEKEKANWEADRLRLQEEADNMRASSLAYNDLIAKLGPDFDISKLSEYANKSPRAEFSIFLKFFESGKDCEIDMTGMDLPGEFITHITNLKIKNDTNKSPVNFHCIRTEF